MFAWNAFKTARLTYSACGPFTKKKERIQKIRETGDSHYIYQNELHKACFQHGMAYGDFNDLIRRTAFSLKSCRFTLTKRASSEIPNIFTSKWYKCV